jgi:uncharacterized protein YdeI (YjbR/CyaY-like superfamily)
LNSQFFSAAVGVECRAMSKATPKRDPRVDAYIAKAADFAKPILVHLREVVAEGCPEAVETVKWSQPSWEYKGLLCGMAAFKQHCTFGFWKHSLVVGEDRYATDEAKGQFGRITKVSDLPSRKALLGYLRKAVKLNDDGVKIERPKRKPLKPLPVPPDLAAALKKNKAAAGHFEAFSPSKRKDYIEWLTEAKSEETRTRRLTTAVEWIAEGKARHWKYERC